VNWKRIGTGTLWAAGILIVLDWVNIVIGQWMFGPGTSMALRDQVTIIGLLLVPSLLTGFLLSWLYALARPRLGPGPKTALLVGSIGFLLGNQHLLSPTLWISSPAIGIYQTLVPWLKFLAATYVAGWQYIEKAPS
jgi:hypothetical protein